MELDAEDYEALGYGNVMEALALSGWAEFISGGETARKLEWARSGVGRASRRQYRMSAAGKQTDAAWYQKNAASKKAKVAAYKKTPAGKLAKAEAQRRYRARKKAQHDARS